MRFFFAAILGPGMVVRFFLAAILESCGFSLQPSWSHAVFFCSHPGVMRFFFAAILESCGFFCTGMSSHAFFFFWCAALWSDVFFQCIMFLSFALDVDFCKKHAFPVPVIQVQKVQRKIFATAQILGFCRFRKFFAVLRKKIKSCHTLAKPANHAAENIFHCTNWPCKSS